MTVDEIESQEGDMIFLGLHSEPYTGRYKINGRILQFQLFFQYFELSFLAEQNTYKIKKASEIRHWLLYCINPYIGKIDTNLIQGDSGESST